MANTLDETQLEALWESQGGAAVLAPTMAAIAEVESSGDPTAVSPTGATGLWQIEWPLHDGIVPGADTQTALQDPEVNAQAAIALSRNDPSTQPGSPVYDNWIEYEPGAGTPDERYLSYLPAQNATLASDIESVGYSGGSNSSGISGSGSSSSSGSSGSSGSGSQPTVPDAVSLAQHGQPPTVSGGFLAALQDLLNPTTGLFDISGDLGLILSRTLLAAAGALLVVGGLAAIILPGAARTAEAVTGPEGVVAGAAIAAARKGGGRSGETVARRVFSKIPDKDDRQARAAAKHRPQTENAYRQFTADRKAREVKLANGETF